MVPDRPLRQLLAAVSMLALSACSANLDAECADLFEDLTKELDHVLEAESFDERVERLGKLNDYDAAIADLNERAGETISGKISSGEIYSDLNPDSDPSQHKLIFDDLNRRKAVALNAFNQRRFEIRDNELKAAGLGFFDDDSVMFKAVELSVACNQTLR